MNPTATLSLTVRSLAALVDATSSPVVRPRIDPEASERLLAQALDGRGKREYVVHLAPQSADLPPAEVAAVVRGHFAEEARLAECSLRQHIREARKALAIALAIIAVLFAGVESLRAAEALTIHRLISASFVVIAWVTMWTPLEILIFQNLFTRRRIGRLRALSRARVEVVPLPAA